MFKNVTSWAGAIVLLTTLPTTVQGVAILGTWHGTSICADRVQYPGCNNEEVIYQVVAGPGRDSVTVKADRITGGERVSMGDIEVGQAKDSSWAGVFQTGRGRVKLTLKVVADSMRGTLSDVASGGTIRQIAVGRTH